MASMTDSSSSLAVPVDPPKTAPVDPDALTPVFPRRSWYLPVKAATDFAVALVLLALTGPVIVLAAALVRLTSPGPAFYCQRRLGKDGRGFTVFKLRTMVDGAEAESGPVWAEPDDPRITPVGKLLRTMHVDELPQLLNVLLGQMSLVGPRPERPEIVSESLHHLPGYLERLNVRPGLTGLAQLRLPADVSLDCVRRKLVYDLYYVRHAGPWLDVRILLATALRVWVDVLKGLWMLIEPPRWKTVQRHGPVPLDGESPVLHKPAAQSGNGSQPKAPRSGGRRSAPAEEI